jgi:hypothetical protein
MPVIGQQWKMCLFLAVVSRMTAQDRHAPACLPEQIQTSQDAGLAAGSIFVKLELRNVSDRACSVTGAPRIVALMADHARKSATVHWPVDAGDVHNGQKSAVLPAGGRALLVIHTLDSTGFPDSQACAETLRLYLPHSTGDRPVATVSAQSCKEIEVSGYQPLVR